MTETKTWKGLYLVGGIAGLLCVIGVVADIIIGTSLGADLTRLPQTAGERFAEFAVNPWLGLYHLDLLNLVTTLLSLPFFLAVCAALRSARSAWTAVALGVFVLGAAVFTAGNAALPMLELSQKYAAAPAELQAMYIAAGEALLARGAHGGTGAFPGFLLLALANLLLAVAMLRGRVFRPLAGVFGVVAGALLLGYVVAVTFVPASRTVAMAVAAPGGLLSLVWEFLIAWRLFDLAHKGEG